MRHTLALIAFATAAAAAAPSLALAAPVRVTFLNCGLVEDCSGPTTIMSSFDAPDIIRAPAVPPAGNFTPVADVPVTRQVAGHFDGLGIRSFNNNGFIGSDFIFEDLTGADGFDYPLLMSVGAYRTSGLQLRWDIGTYTGLGRFNCLRVDCLVQTTLQNFVRLDITAIPPTNTVPEPMTASLVAVALGAGWCVRRRRGA